MEIPLSFILNRIALNSVSTSSSLHRRIERVLTDPRRSKNNLNHLRFQLGAVLLRPVGRPSYSIAFILKAESRLRCEMHSHCSLSACVVSRSLIGRGRSVARSFDRLPSVSVPSSDPPPVPLLRSFSPCIICKPPNFKVKSPWRVAWKEHNVVRTLPLLLSKTVFPVPTSSFVSRFAVIGNTAFRISLGSCDKGGIDCLFLQSSFVREIEPT